MLSKLGVSWRECRTALLLTTLLVVAVPVHAQVGGVILGTVVDD